MNSRGWGYDLTLAELCHARIGVLDNQVIEISHISSYRRVHSEGTDPRDLEAMDQMQEWIGFTLNLETEQEVEQYRHFVTVTRPNEFAYCQVPLPTREELEWARRPLSLPPVEPEEKDGECLIQDPPSLKHPFFFFEIPYSNASELGNAVYRAAQGLDLMIYTPGARGSTFPGDWHVGHHNPVCPFNSDREPLACMFPKVVACSAVISGLFGTSLVKAMLVVGDTVHPSCRREWKENSVVAGRGGVPFEAFSCIVALRHPFHSLLACYKLDLKEKYGPYSSLSGGTERKVLEACGSHLILRYLGGEPPYTRGGKGIEIPGQGGSLEVAKQTIDHCFVALPDTWLDTVRGLRRVFPWMEGGTFGMEKWGLNEFDWNQEFSGEQLSGLEERMVEDIELFNYALLKFERQTKEC